MTKTVTTEKQEVGEKAEAIDLVVRPTGFEPVTPRSVVDLEAMKNDGD